MPAIRSVAAAVGALALAVAGANAQVFREPLLYSSGVQPPGTLRDPYVVNMAPVETFWGVTSPEQSAQQTCERIRAALYDGPWDGTGAARPSYLAGRKIAILFRTFAVDTPLADGVALNSDIRLFREADRMAGLDDHGILHQPPNGTYDELWPTPRPQSPLDPDDYGTARAYRQPSPINAWNGPLRAWMIRWVAEYRRIEQAIVTPGDPLYDPTRPLPDPDLALFDSEGAILLPGSNNGPFCSGISTPTSASCGTTRSSPASPIRSSITSPCPRPWRTCTRRRAPTTDCPQT